jgi:FkbM family methyltransferase
LTLRRALIRALDRPGGRAILAAVATRAARKAGVADVEVRYDDGLWTHRVGGHLFPDSPTFEYHSGSFAEWPQQAERWRAEATDYWFHVYQPAPGDVIVDVGAGRGEDVLAFSAAVGPAGRVIAVEADPASFELLARFCVANGLANVHCVQAAITDRPGTVHIETGGQWERRSIVSRTERSMTVPVAGLTLDGLCESLNLARIDFLKMNIEGAERPALEGMDRTVEKLRYACIAGHDFRADAGDGEHYRTAGAVTEFLRRKGLTVVRRENDSRPWARDHVHASRPAAAAR